MARSTNGNLYLLANQDDGVRVYEFDPGGTTILAQALLGTAGDAGYGLALDAANNVYITGTTTSGAITGSSTSAFPSASSGSINGFVARFDDNLNITWTGFLGGAKVSPQAIAVNAGAIYITGDVIGSALPVTPSAIVQSPPSGTTQNGFVESFSLDGATLRYATYLGGINGFTAPAAITADASGNAFVAGYTEASGYPTINALISEMVPPEGASAGSGFVTELDPGGDAFLYSTFIGGDGITALALDATGANLYLAGSIAPNAFPISQWSLPVTDANPISLVSLGANGTSINWVTAVAQGDTTALAVDANNNAWLTGQMTAPMLPSAALSEIGDAYAIRIRDTGAVDRTLRLGGDAAEYAAYSTPWLAPNAAVTDAAGNLYLAGSVQPATDTSLLSAVFYDQPMLGPDSGAASAALPNSLRDLVPASSNCASSSACTGSGAYLAQVAPTDGASIAVSTDTLPNLVVRNLGSLAAANISISVSGYSYASNCGTTIASGSECSIALTGSGPGTLTIASSSIAAPLNFPLAANSASTAPDAIALSTRELDFGVVSAAGSGASGTVTVTNLTATAQILTSVQDNGVALPLSRGGAGYGFSQSATTCTAINGDQYQLAANASCTITLAFTASGSSASDGMNTGAWAINGRDVTLRAYSQAAAISLSSTELDFGTQYQGGTLLPRYLYLQNNSTSAVTHATVSLPANSPFIVTDNCPSTIAPGIQCSLRVNYFNATAPSADTATLTLDDGATVLLTGTTKPAPGVTSASVNPYLNVSPTSITFADPVIVTEVSSTPQTVSISNSGISAIPLQLNLAGDFTDTTNCGGTLSGGANCTVYITFAPSQSGTRAGLLTVSDGTDAPITVSLSGTGTAITTAINGAADFGDVPVGESSIQWLQITQGFGTLTATATNGYTILLVQDEGFGHGSPSPQTFSSTASNACSSCWLGIQFQPVDAGTVTGVLSLTSITGGNANTIALTGNGVILTAPYISPATFDFGSIPVHSISAGTFFTVTNGNTQTVTLSAPAISSQFSVLSTTCGTTLAAGDSCLVQLAYAPTVAGTASGILSISASGTIISASLTGYGNPDPGVAFSPDALDFSTLPGAAAALQTITVTNTGTTALAIGAPTTGTANFSTSSNCFTLAVNLSCVITVAFTPSSSTVADTLTVPVTPLGGSSTSYSIALSGNYTASDAKLVITPGTMDFGVTGTGSLGLTRTFTVTNLTAAPVTLSTSMPRQFTFAGAPCTTLAANGTCEFDVQFQPLTNGAITGSVVVGTASSTAIAYLQGTGLGAASIGFSSNVVNDLVNFGLVNSSQSATQVITLTNTGTATLNIRRVTTEWPFSAATTCGAPLAPNATCTVTLTFSPLFEYAVGTSAPTPLAETGTLVIESDASTAPDVLDLTGVANPVASASPGNSGSSATLTPSALSLNFPITAIGNASGPQTVTLTNSGTSSIQINSIAAGTGFTVQDINCIGTLSSGASCSFSAAFAPTSGGRQFSAIEIQSSAASPLDYISVSGEAQASQLSVSPDSLSFSPTPEGTSASLTTIISNTGSTDATVGPITATGDYSLSGNCIAANSTIAAGAACTVTVSFAPTTTGTRTGAISIPNSVTASPLTVSLSGTGTAPDLAATVTQLNFASVTVGQAISQRFMLQNFGTASATSLAISATGDFSAVSTCGTSLAPSAACTVTVTFAPTTYGARTGTLSIASSGYASPLNIPLSGYGLQPGGFTVSITPGTSATQNAPHGQTATYSLTVAAYGGFAGVVDLTCSAQQTVPYAACSIVPSSIALNNTTTTANVSITTIAVVPSTSSQSKNIPTHRSILALCLIAPGAMLLVFWKRRNRLPRSIALIAVFAIAMCGLQGCGSDNIDVRLTPPGNYTYLITADATSGQFAAQSITLQLEVPN